MRRLVALIAVVVTVTNFDRVKATAAEVRPPLVATSPWMKSCLKNSETGFKTTCITSNQVTSEADRSLVAAVAIIEPEDGKKKLRVTFRLGVQIGPGTRLITDHDDPQRSPYVACTASGCMSDYEAGSGMIDGMKRGQVLFVQAVDTAGAPLTVQLPLTDFAAAYDGPPSDPRSVGTPRKPKPWLDDALQPSLRPRPN
jgi:invasion protein IalB